MVVHQPIVYIVRKIQLCELLQQTGMSHRVERFAEVERNDYHVRVYCKKLACGLRSKYTSAAVVDPLGWNANWSAAKVKIKQRTEKCRIDKFTDDNFLHQSC